MFPLASFLFSLLGLLISTYTDFRWRIIPNWIPAGLAIVGVLLAGYESYITQSLNPPFFSVGIMIVTYVVAYLFWKVGAWAGGDVKLFTSLASLNPFNPFFLGSFFSLSFVWGGRELLFPSTFPVFMLNLFMLSVLMLFPYTALLALSVLHHSDKRKTFFTQIRSGIVDALKYGLMVVLIVRLVEVLFFPYWFSIILFLLLAFFPDFFKWILAGVSFILLLLSFIPLSLFLPIVGAILIFNILRSSYSFAQKHVLTQTKRITQLEEGDIPGELLLFRDGKIIRESPVSFHTIIKAGFQRDLTMIFSALSSSGEILANPRQAAGFYPDQIDRLKLAVKKGLVADEIKVKASAPFAPAVLLAYILLNLFGDGPLAWWYG